MSYVKQRQRNYSERMKLNKSRSRTMERNVAKKLGGNRVPMSGSGMLKGDGLVYFSRGLYIIECKFSALRMDEVHGLKPKMRFDYRWLKKLDEDVAAMKARFGILVIQYHQHSDYYVFLKEPIFRQYVSDTEPISDGIIEMRSGINLIKNTLDEKMQQSRCIRITTSVGEYVAMHIKTFKELFDVREGQVDGGEYVQ